MSLAQRVLLTWLFTLLFLIMLVLKLDEKAPWNWFLIFIPVWIFDTILLVMLIVKMAGRCKSGFDPRHGSHNIKKKAWYLIAMLLKLAFCLALCAKLEQFTTMNLSYVFIPLWALLTGALTELGYNVFFCERLTAEYIVSSVAVQQATDSVLSLCKFQDYHRSGGKYQL